MHSQGWQTGAACIYVQKVTMVFDDLVGQHGTQASSQYNWAG
jgi:hypothetical protein